MNFTATVVHCGKETQTLPVEAITREEARTEAETSLMEQWGEDILNKVWIDVREADPSI